MNSVRFLAAAALLAPHVGGAAYAQSATPTKATTASTASTSAAATTATAAPVAAEVKQDAKAPQQAAPMPYVMPGPDPVAQPPAAPVASAYRVNPGDDLEVYVWGEERLQRVVRVLPDGTMSFPLVGQIVAQGQRLSDLESTISSRLAGQYRGQVPQVTVSVKAASGMQFSIMGRVKAPGTFTPGRYVNVLEALSLAGGPAEFANLDNVLLIRKSGDRVSTQRLHLGSVFRSGAAGSSEDTNIQRIQPGDTVIVP